MLAFYVRATEFYWVLLSEIKNFEDLGTEVLDDLISRGVI